MNTRRIRILVVDDDLRMRTLLKEFFEQQGLVVHTLANGRQISQALVKHRVDIMILDVMMPGEDGLSVCKRLRAKGINVPIILLTAKGEDVDKILGLEMGADDYLPKPFNPRELLARVGAVLRRRNPSASAGPGATENSVFKFGPYELSAGTRRLTKGAQVIPLTSGEFAVLYALVSHPREPLSRVQLVELSRRREFGAFDRSMDVQVSRLRRLIEPNSSNPIYIQTVWGFGYVFIPDGAPT